MIQQMYNYLSPFIAAIAASLVDIFFHNTTKAA